MPSQDGRRIPCLAIKPSLNFISLFQFLIPYLATLIACCPHSAMFPKKSSMSCGAGIVLYSQS